jgi:hypothetical protein
LGEPVVAFDLTAIPIVADPPPGGYLVTNVDWRADPSAGHALGVATGVEAGAVDAIATRWPSARFSFPTTTTNWPGWIPWTISV